MAKPFIDLRDRVVLDTGEVVAKYEMLKKRLRSEQDITRMRVFATTPLQQHEVSSYNRRIGADQPKLKLFKEGDIEGPATSTFDWNIPEEYRALDVVERAIEGLVRMDIPDDVLPVYQQRIADELSEMEHRGMFDFLRALIYVTDQFRARDVVWGVGRGSSCASLVMFALGVNKVDPVKYDIPLDEFLKPGVEDE